MRYAQSPKQGHNENGIVARVDVTKNNPQRLGHRPNKHRR